MLLLRLLHLLCVCVVLLLRGCCLDLLYEAVNARQQPTRRRKCFCLGFIFLQSKFRPTRNNNNNEKENNSAFFESGTKPREILSFKPLAFFVFRLGYKCNSVFYFGTRGRPPRITTTACTNSKENNPKKIRYIMLNHL